MDFDFTPEQQRFRAEARAWLVENVPADLKGRAFAASRADRGEVDRLREWQKVLHKAGYVGIDWPAEYGGRGTSIMEQIILYEEMSRAEAPQPVNRGGISMLGPTLMSHGTPAQKARHLGK
ncbi:MAG TPA: acyl-CoA dehydrogenase family protein, partial [Verrucomicrobiae bacterium]|nr:acyl-CoA dehydrogenase family protein [Verrucomicrobiae bacterium]